MTSRRAAPQLQVAPVARPRKPHLSQETRESLRGVFAYTVPRYGPLPMDQIFPAPNADAEVL